MKNLKNYCFIVLFALSVSVVFFACSNESEQANGVAGSSVEINKNITAKPSSIQSSDCDIQGETVISDGNAVVNAGSVAYYNYSFYNNNGALANLGWSFTEFPAGSAVMVSNGTSVTITYYSNFESATLTAYGTGVTGLNCDSDLKIKKAPSNPLCESCTPFFANELYDTSETGPSPVQNAIYFGERSCCNFSWSNVSSVHIQIGGVYGVGSNASEMPNINTMGQTGGFANNSNWTTTPSGFKNIKIRTHLNGSDVDPGFLRNNTLTMYGGWATIKFNDGRPDVILYLNDDDAFSPIY